MVHKAQRVRGAQELAGTIQDRIRGNRFDLPEPCHVQHDQSESDRSSEIMERLARPEVAQSIAHGGSAQRATALGVGCSYAGHLRSGFSSEAQGTESASCVEYAARFTNGGR